MAENTIELKSVRDLLGMKFYIPCYQRGYRWTPQQVTDLLEDLEEFRQKISLSDKDNDREIETDDFYCLQPLVVKERIIDENDFIKALPKSSDGTDILSTTRNAIANNTKWEVIDGQQRLTTIHILLKFLTKESVTNDIEDYSIDYETRNGFGTFLGTLLNTNSVKAFEVFIKYNGNSHQWDNIDFYHIWQTYDTIVKWFQSHNDSKSFLKTLLDRVKFIWYKSVDEDPIKVFTRLNIGKIKLTNSELIKALFLNRSNFIENTSEHLKLRQQEIASQWDNIEYTLQNDEFWLFLHKKDYARPTRIDLIFDLICEQDSLGMGKSDKIGNDEYRTFRYFYNHFKSEEPSLKKYWDEVKKYFQTFQEWFNDLELYHYVGYLINQGEKLEELCIKWRSSKASHEDFIKCLKEIIKGEIAKHKDLSEQYEIEIEEDGKKTKKAKTDCRPLLLLHNIQTVINQNKAYQEKEEYQLPVFYKFPFHLYKREKWDVEHIDSNTTNDLEKKGDQKEWLMFALLDHNLDENIRIKILQYLKGENQEAFNDLFHEIEEQRTSNAGWENPESDKNKIWNFVLLDAGTNRGYGNAIFPAKRCCIIGRDRGENLRSGITKIDISQIADDISIDKLLELIRNVTDENGSIAFIPPVTKNVFLKYYSSAASDFRAWTRQDAEAYKRNILETLKDFGVIDSSNNEETEESDGKK